MYQDRTDVRRRITKPQSTVDVHGTRRTIHGLRGQRKGDEKRDDDDDEGREGDELL